MGAPRYTCCMDYEGMLTVKEIAERLKVHAGTVRKWLEEKQLRGVRLGGSTGWRVPEAELVRFLKERES